VKKRKIFCPLRQTKLIFWLANTLTTILTYSKLFAKCVHIGLHGPKLVYENLYKHGTIELTSKEEMQTSGSASASSFRKNCSVKFGGVCVDIATCTLRSQLLCTQPSNTGRRHFI